MDVATQLRVRVPASTSNLGPGFDLLGLALSIFLEVEVEITDEGHEFLSLEGTAGSWPVESNLLTRAFDEGTALLSAPRRGLRVRATSEIPVARGLGSSGAAIAAGLALAANCAGSSRPDQPELCQLAFQLEGHPDNTTASLTGGCTLALPHEGGLAVVQQPIHPSLGFAVAWPSGSVSTAEARSALPTSVPFQDAVENPRRLAILLEGLRTGAPELLALGLEDRLHVRHRLGLIRGGAQGLAAALAAGAHAATVSGSGSTLIAISPPEHASDVAEAMSTALGAADGPAEGRVVQPIFGPPKVETLD